MSSTKAVKFLRSVDKTLAKLIDRVGPCTLALKTQAGKTNAAQAGRLKAEICLSPFHSLAESIAYQQLTGKAAKTIWTRVLALYKGKYPTPQQILKTKPDKLRAAGLSHAKIAALRDLALKAIDDVVPTIDQAHELSDQELVERLTSVRGIGPWTVEMFLIFNLGRPDIMPVADYGVRNGFALTYGLAELPKPKELLKLAEPWKPYRTYAAWYFWRAVDLHRLEKGIKAAQTKTTPAEIPGKIPEKINVKGPKKRSAEKLKKTK